MRLLWSLLKLILRARDCALRLRDGERTRLACFKGTDTEGDEAASGGLLVVNNEVF